MLRYNIDLSGNAAQSNCKHQKDRVKKYEKQPAFSLISDELAQAKKSNFGRYETVDNSSLIAMSKTYCMGKLVIILKIV